jgi:hypothetical protein
MLPQSGALMKIKKIEQQSVSNARHNGLFACQELILIGVSSTLWQPVVLSPPIRLSEILCGAAEFCAGFIL